MDKEELFKQVIGPIIREKRHSKGWTLERLAHEIDMDDKHIGRLERGEKAPSGLTLTLLQNALDLSSDEIIQKFEARLKDET